MEENGTSCRQLNTSERASFWTCRSVDEVPAALKPVFWIYSYSGAALLFLYFALVRLTSHVARRGEENLAGGDAYLFTCWHDQFPIYLASRRRHSGQAWMVFAAWYMKPMHLLARWTGVEQLIYGATGHSGRAAARKLVTELTLGRSTVFLPDGPFCRPREPRKGILHMAQASGVAIVPLNLRASRALYLRTWDRKAVPLPFSRIELQYGSPIEITQIDDEALETLKAALGAG